MFVERAWRQFKSNFRHNPQQDAIVYLCIVMVALLMTAVCVFEPLLTPPCDVPRPAVFPFKNLKFDDSPCRRMRYLVLLGLTPTDAMIGRRMLVAMGLAALIGYERRSPDQPAGVRTMSVTALGACCFTISSIFAFESGTMHWDASRVTAAIPSGVGFLGSAIVFKELIKHGDRPHHTVSGLSTAASVWISAAVGVAAGGALYYTAVFTTMTCILLLRFGPANPHSEEGGDEDGSTSDKKPHDAVEAAERTPLLKGKEPLTRRALTQRATTLASHT
mmetsp:Transcript_8497/g.25540  ORF Transcript_8497/g.25540 Transcript_8497/m.25540 type:complete len:276 (+) Transcript_8497:219-1046(+)|eukprot:CAMPEP_0198736870 /NCGR_PEP_ID=MMETSP1475-20131203/67553_1 /TAXON_ID= ORGANISM="Unidentified sp., Strain CCMP1999" /NCGR_SAMPLE_ID=MMETSP1475 /ASSEMBLY_ACC=CAM_ASM_001111 /LENGTH=275 /DNA_ID=CAMNT_0044500723 /DNA_START=172 /DNA_END=999 /DNA_ORIENTATION=-